MTSSRDQSDASDAIEPLAVGGIQMLSLKVPQRFGMLALAMVLASASYAGQPEKDGPDLQPGLVHEGFNIGEPMLRLPRLVAGQRPNTAGIINSINFSGAEDGNNFKPLVDSFFTRVQGFIKVRRTGNYVFRLKSDDGAILYVNEEIIVNNDGMHGPVPVDGLLALRRGVHRLRIDHFDGGGADTLILEWQPPGARSFQLAPAGLFFHDGAVDLSTTTGLKKVEKVDPTEGMSREEAIEHAIELGVHYLLSEEARSIGPAEGRHRLGHPAVETYALIVSGVSASNPQIIKNFTYLDRELKKDPHTYALACTIMAYDAAIAQLEQDRILMNPEGDPADWIGNVSLARTHYKRIREVGKLLLNNQNPGGGWRYAPGESGGDISCTQFAVLGLAAAAQRGFKIPIKSWEEAAGFLTRMQIDTGPSTPKRATLERSRDKEESGGRGAARGRERGKGGGTAVAGKEAPSQVPVAGTWEVLSRRFGYTGPQKENDGVYSWNRTCAGVSSLAIIDHLIGHRLDIEVRKKFAKAARDGCGWMMDNWTPFGCYYGLYSLEKVGDTSGIKLFNGIDWYHEAVTWLLEKQGPRGNWNKTSIWGENERTTTALALLVLNRATAFLTRDPADRLIATGQERKTDANARLWVYMEELDRSIYLPQIIRTLRYRPQKKIMEFFARVCSSYPETWRPELVDPLLRLRAAITDGKMSEILQECLDRVCGIDLGPDREYRIWLTKWVRAKEIGDNEDLYAHAELLDIYAFAADSWTLKSAVVRSSLRINSREILPLLIDDLLSPIKELRVIAARGVNGLFVDPAPFFDWELEVSELQEAAAELERWALEQLKNAPKE